MERFLSDAGIKPSPVRLLVLKVLSQSRNPISSLDLETSLDTVDRSSISRTLTLFSEKHLVHQISDGSGSMKYELCHSRPGKIHIDEHPHFHCNVCGKTICIADCRIPEVELPAGYHVENANYLLSGICPDCRKL